MTDADWNEPSTASLAMFLAGRGLDTVDEEGIPVVDDDLVLLVNGSHVDLDWVFPKRRRWNRGRGELLVDTSAPDPSAPERVLAVGEDAPPGEDAHALSEWKAAEARMTLTP